MAVQITFTEPDGTIHDAPEAAWLRELVLNRGNDYWQAGSGDAAIWYDPDAERRARLILMKHEPEGFFLLYEPPDEGGYFCPVGKDGEGSEIDLCVGGEMMSVPSGQMLSPKLAWEVVADFLHDGGRSSRLEWQKWL